MTDKAALRLRLIAQRRALSPEERTQASERAQAALLSLPELQHARTLALYRPMGNEVETALLVDALRDRRLCFPALSADGTTLRLLAGSAGFERHPRGFEVPGDDGIELALGEVDVVVLPGVAFDRFGGRLGRGAGHYDRLLALPHRALRVGLAFDFQLLEAPLPRDPWDVPLHAVCTGSGVHRALPAPAH